MIRLYLGFISISFVSQLIKLTHSKQTTSHILNCLPLQTKLEEALHLAMDFHNSLQDFINWLTQAEQTLNVASRPSLILDTILFQIDEHKVRGNSDRKHLTSRARSAFLSQASV